jgi:MraZ protein
LLQGASQLSLDDKGRLAVPTKHRDALLAGGRSVVLTGHPDGCLALFPRRDWEPVRTKLQSLSSFDPIVRMWQRLIVGFAEELELDAQGRILISPALRKFASLKKEALMIGRGTHFELWDNAAWEAKLEQELPRAASQPPPGTENFTL